MPSIKEQLAEIVKSKNTGAVASINTKNLLERECKRLKDCIQNQIENYYDSYNPITYNRTEKFKHSLRVEDITKIKVVGNSISLSLYFEDDLAYHDTNTSKGNGYVPLLANDGWKQSNAKYDHYHAYRGYRFVEKGIEDFNRNNPYNIQIQVQKTYQGNTYSLADVI